MDAAPSPAIAASFALFAFSENNSGLSLTDRRAATVAASATSSAAAPSYVLLQQRLRSPAYYDVGSPAMLQLAIEWSSWSGADATLALSVGWLGPAGMSDADALSAASALVLVQRLATAPERVK